jgi:hypothetical protein
MLAACGDRDAAQLETVKREVCACDSVACAEAAMKKVPQADGTPTRRDQSIARDMLDCLAKLKDAAAPQLPP